MVSFLFFLDSSPPITSCGETDWAGLDHSWIQFATEFDFVANAIAASAADRLAWLTKASSVQNDAYKHQSLAIAGLNQALKIFSKENSDAVLCTSILLCLQHRNW